MIAINNIAYNRYDYNPLINECPPKNTSFCGKIKADSLELTLSKSLKKLGNFTIKEYKTLSEPEKETLRATYNELTKRNMQFYYKNAEVMHDEIAENMKQYFDKKYGKKKYTVITVGRSLSSIGKVLGYKIGEKNVINIPLSGADKFAIAGYIEHCRREGGINILRKYLNKIGLNRKQISHSKKTYVITDYCNTGESLNGAKRLLTEPDVLGSKNIEAVDVLTTIKSPYYRNEVKNTLQACKYKKFAFVKQAHKLEDIPSANIDPQKAELDQKLVWFNLLDNQVTPKDLQTKTEPHRSLFWDSILKKIF